MAPPKKSRATRPAKAPAKARKASTRAKPELTPAMQKFEDALRACLPQERLFVKHKLNRKTNERAAILAGYSEKTAEVQGSQLLSRLRVWEAYSAGLEAAGFGPQDILGDIQDLRNFNRAEIEREIKEPVTEYVERRVSDLLRELKLKEKAVRAHINAQETVPDEATLKLQGEQLLSLQRRQLALVEKLAIDPNAVEVELVTRLVTQRVLCYDLAKQKGLLKFIKSRKPGKYGDVVELHDWVTGVEMGAKAMAVFKDRHEVTGKDGEALPAGTIIVLPSNGRDGANE